MARPFQQKKKKSLNSLSAFNNGLPEKVPLLHEDILQEVGPLQDYVEKIHQNKKLFSERTIRIEKFIEL